MSFSLPDTASAIKARASSIASDASTASNTSSSSSSPLLLRKRSLSFSSISGADDKGLSGANRKKSFQKQAGRLAQSHHINMLRIVWILALLMGESGVYWTMVYRCAWPEHSTWDSSESALLARYRIAIVADPQLTDWYSYKQSGLALWFTEFYTDIFMRRSFTRLHRNLQPDAVLFLGDLMDGGRETMDQRTFEKNRDRFLEKVFDSGRTAWNLWPLLMDEEDLGEKVEIRGHKLEGKAVAEGSPSSLSPNSSSQHNSTYDGQDESDQSHMADEDITGHFQQIIEVPSDSSERAAIRSSGRSVRLYVAGNHEVGFGDTIVRKAVRRYKQEFGSVNYEINVGNHSLVVLDTLALSANLTSIQKESREFMTRLGQEMPLLPRILFTHVPLFRLDTTFCGEARESEHLIFDRNGEQYQNMVNASLSREILHNIQPDMIFSGDDHDWCEIVHSLDDKLTPEVTVPTFSFAQGSKQPAFVILSLFNPEKLPRSVAPSMPESVARQLHNGSAISGAEGGAGTVLGRETEANLASSVALDSPTFAYEECMLPRQMSIYSGYIILFGLTLAWIVVLRFCWFMQSRHSDPLLIRWRHMPLRLKTARSLSTPHPLQGQGQKSVAQRSTSRSQKPQELPQMISPVGLADLDANINLDGKNFRAGLDSPPLQRPLSPWPLLMGMDVVGSSMRLGRNWQTQIQHRTWPVWRLQFWRVLAVDLCEIFRFVVPVYLLLLVVSLM